jgi:DNA processing protein
MEEKDYWLGFSVFPGVGPITFKKLLTEFSSAENAWNANEDQVISVLGKKKGNNFLQFRETFNFDTYKSRLAKANVTVVTLPDAPYPLLLKQIKNPPFVLYTKGDMSIKNSKTIGIVGTRKITQYGREVTKLFTQDLVLSGCTIVSGLAMGVDAVAHKTTLENGGKTIAVLGCGVDCCSPSENQVLYDDIIENGGAILSEVPLGMSPTIGTFPARNRIVAGLSQGILVTEGAEDSGALITADFAFKSNRNVFAVPGPITSSLSKGPYKLIEKGAKLVTKVEDILREFQISNVKFPISNKETPRGDTKEEQAIIDLLEKEALGFDELVRRLKIDSAQIGSILSLMEVKGFIQSHEGGHFSLNI